LAQSDYILVLKGSRCLAIAWGIWCAQREIIYPNVADVAASSKAMQQSKDFAKDREIVNTVLEEMGFERADDPDDLAAE